MIKPSPEWQKGFDDGLAWAKSNFNPNTGGMSLPGAYQHRGGGWHNGFGEGIITGRSGKISSAFPGARSISYKDGKAVVMY